MARIAFAGPMSSGKTKCTKVLQNVYGGRILSFAFSLKQLAYEFWGVNDKSKIYKLTNDKVYTGREIYQVFGNKMREIDPDFWIKRFQKRLNETTGNVFVDDLRFNNEEKLLKDNGFKIIQLLVPTDIRMARLQKRDGSIPPKRTLFTCGETTVFTPDYKLFNLDIEKTVEEIRYIFEKTEREE